MARSLDARATTSSSRSYMRAGEIARGGMGNVELVVLRDGRFRRLYAMKRLHPHFRDDPGFRSMFLDEARIAGLLCHPNAVSVLDVGQDEEGPYLIMDFVDGIPAAKLVSRCAREGIPLPVQICVRIAIEAARGLHAAHELRDETGARLGLVHRDVSPQNILISYGGTVQVADFGIAKAFGNTARTATGVLKGTMGYLSPEQLRFEEPDQRSDLFSLGVTLYELLAGEHLYARRGGIEAGRRILHEPPPDIGETREDVPSDLVELLFELLAKSPGDRPTSALKVADRLDAILSSLVAEEGVIDLAAFMSTHAGDLRILAQPEWTRRLAALPDLGPLADVVSSERRPRRRGAAWALALGAVGLALFAVLPRLPRGPRPPAAPPEATAQPAPGPPVLKSGDGHAVAPAPVTASTALPATTTSIVPRRPISGPRPTPARPRPAANRTKPRLFSNPF